MQSTDVQGLVKQLGGNPGGGNALEAAGLVFKDDDDVNFDDDD